MVAWLTRSVHAVAMADPCAASLFGLRPFHAVMEHLQVKSLHLVGGTDTAD